MRQPQCFCFTSDRQLKSKPLPSASNSPSTNQVQHLKQRIPMTPPLLKRRQLLLPGALGAFGLKLRQLLLVVFVSATVSMPASADNWPQWRGPKNDGHSAEKGLPTEWGPEKNVVWKF